MRGDHAGPLVPAPYRVAASRRETADVVTLDLAPGDGEALAFRAGQFTMLTAFGVGEAAISVSGSPRSPGCLQQTIRDVGPVTRALCQARPGDVVGVRGPFGSAWGAEDVAELGGGDVVVVAGGIGLAPLRGAIDLLLHPRAAPGPRVFVLVGRASRRRSSLPTISGRGPTRGPRWRSPSTPPGPNGGETWGW